MGYLCCLSNCRRWESFSFLFSHFSFDRLIVYCLNMAEFDLSDENFLHVEVEDRSIRILLCDTPALVQKAVQVLLRCSHVAVDLEGVNLSRSGPISLIQVAPVGEDVVYLFDVTKLKELAFHHGLYLLLTSKSVMKIFFDVRGDSDALFYQYHFVATPVVDCQIAMMSGGRRQKAEYLCGLKKAFLYSHALTDTVKEALNAVKEAGLQHFARECGGSIEAWDQRPLPQELVVYAAVDVWYLHAIFQDYFNLSGMSMETLELHTRKRIMRSISSETEMKGPHMAKRDF